VKNRSFTCDARGGWGGAVGRVGCKTDTGFLWEAGRFAGDVLKVICGTSTTTLSNNYSQSTRREKMRLEAAIRRKTSIFPIGQHSFLRESCC